MSGVRLILASQSVSRRRMLDEAGVTFDYMPSHIDEEALKESFRSQGLGARPLADALAEIKALRLSAQTPGAFVLGCDQTLELEDGAMLNKAQDRAEAAAILRRLSGTSHKLHSAAVICEEGNAVWRHIETAKLTVRALSNTFIDSYLDAEWELCRACVGCYRIEGRGAQLFSRIEGTHFAIQGLPLLALLDFLRVRGLLVA